MDIGKVTFGGTVACDNVLGFCVIDTGGCTTPFRVPTNPLTASWFPGKVPINPPTEDTVGMVEAIVCIPPASALDIQLTPCRAGLCPVVVGLAMEELPVLCPQEVLS